jgi:hypothetical protein
VTDEDLLVRQAALQERAREVLAGLDLAALAADAGPLLVTGSFVSGLMGWPEVDVMVHVGPDFAPPGVLVPDEGRRGELWTSRVWPGALLVGGPPGRRGDRRYLAAGGPGAVGPALAAAVAR